MKLDRPIVVQRLDDEEEWADWRRAHASVNKTIGSTSVDAGSMRTNRTLTFKVRWAPWCAEVAVETQRYRILYEGHPYAVEDTDDFMEGHRLFSMEGVFYGN